jgi:hypothetical protein
MRTKRYIVGLLLVMVFGACAERVPKSKTVVPHVIKSIEVVDKYNGTTLNYETYYRYEFWDSTPPVMLRKNSRYTIGDTIEYIYIQY